MAKQAINYKVVAPWVGSGHKKGDVITAAQAQKSGDSVDHLVYAGNIEAVEGTAPKPATPKPAAPKGQSKRSQQRAAAKARAAAAPSAPVVVAETVP